MKLITERARIREVLTKHKQSYKRDYRFFDGRQAGEVQDALSLLDLETCPAEAVSEIIGNQSWVTPHHCNECGADDGRPTMQLGEEPDYESSTAWVCIKCLRAAVSLMEAE